MKHYKTGKGSDVYLSGKHGGKSIVEFDWFEEDNACIECCPRSYPEEDEGGLYLQWSCEYCGGGRSKLFLHDERCEDTKDMFA